MKAASTQFHITNLFPVPVQVSVPAGVNRPISDSKMFTLYAKDTHCLSFFAQTWNWKEYLGSSADVEVVTSPQVQFF